MAKSPFYRVIFQKDNYDISDRITQLKFEDCVDEDNLLVITILGADIELIDRASTYKDSSVIFQYGFLEGNKTGNRLAKVKSIEVDYVKNIRLQIKCHDSGFAIKKQKSNRIYEEMTSSDIVRSIAKEFGFEVEIENTTELVTIPQGNKSYFEFLKRLAKKEGVLFYIYDNTIRFKTRDLSKPAKKLYEYGQDTGNVLSFKPKYDDDGESSKVGSSGIDNDSGGLFNIDASGGEDESALGQVLVRWDTNGNRLKSKEVSSKTEVLPESNKSAARKQNKKQANDALLANMTADLKLELDTTVNVEDIISISGVAREHSGNWYVTKKVDQVSKGGAKTDLELSRNATNNKNAGDGTPSSINDSVGDKTAEKTQEVKLRKYDVNGNRTN